MKYIFFSFLGILFCGSCSDNKGFKGLSNTERNNLEIPLLDSNWNFYKKGSRIVEWSNPIAMQALRENLPVHFTKTISYDQSGKVIAENDLFYGNRVFKTIDGTTREQISLTYYLKPMEIGDSLIKGWFCSYTGQMLDHNITNNNKSDTDSGLIRVQIISKTKADEILLKWGFD